VGKVIDRWAAATSIHEHLENVFFQAVQTNVLSEPVTLRVEFKRPPRGEAPPAATYVVRPEPTLDAEPPLLVEVAAQALQALKDQGLPVELAVVTLKAPEQKGELQAEVRVGPLHADLAAGVEQSDPALRFQAVDDKRTPEKLAAELEEIEAWKLVRERCPRKPLGASLRVDVEAEGRTTPREPRPVILRMNAPQAQISVRQMTVDGVPSGNRYGQPQFKLLLFRQPSRDELAPPLRCEQAWVPALARWAPPDAPYLKIWPGSMDRQRAEGLHTARSDKDIQAARDELESQNLKLFDVLQLSFDNLLVLFPAVLLLLSAISASVMRRMATSLPPGVSIGDVLLNHARPSRALTVHDGWLVRGTEKGVRVTLLTLSIFCPLIVILTLPVMADAGFSYEQAALPVVYLYDHARSFTGRFWLLPLGVAWLLGVHQWCLILAPADDGSGRAPLSHARAVRWPLLLLLGVPCTAALLATGVVVLAQIPQAVSGSLQGTPQEPGSVLGAVGAAIFGCLVAAMGVAVVAWWFWVARSRWLDTRRGHRWVIGSCAVGLPVLLWAGADVFFNKDAQPDTLDILSAGAAVLCAWLLYLQLKPRQQRSGKVDALIRWWRRGPRRWGRRRSG